MRAGTWSRKPGIDAGRTSWQGAEQMACAAFERDVVWRSRALSRAPMWTGRWAQAEEILARFDPDNRSVAARALGHSPHCAAVLVGWVTRTGQSGLPRRWRARPTPRPKPRGASDRTGNGSAREQNCRRRPAAAEPAFVGPARTQSGGHFAAFSAGMAMPVTGRGRASSRSPQDVATKQRSADHVPDLTAGLRYSGAHLTGELYRADQRAADYADFSSPNGFPRGPSPVGSRSGFGVPCSFLTLSSIEQALPAWPPRRRCRGELPRRLLLARSYAALGQAAGRRSG